MGAIAKFRPFRALNSGDWYPGLAPWAITLRPVGARGTRSEKTHVELSGLPCAQEMPHFAPGAAYFSIHLWTSSYQKIEFCGFNIQWFSFG